MDQSIDLRALRQNPYFCVHERVDALSIWFDPFRAIVGVSVHRSCKKCRTMCKPFTNQTRHLPDVLDRTLHLMTYCYGL